MNPTDVLHGFALLLVAEVDIVERTDLAMLVATSARLQAWHDSIDMQLARRARQLQQAGRSESAESMFSGPGNRSTKDSETVNKRSEVGDELPSFEAGLANGEVSAGHLDAMASVRKRLDDETRAKFDEHEAELLAAASHESVDAFARRCRELAHRLTPAKSDADELDQQKRRSNVKNWIDKITGMHHTHLELDPLRDAALWGAVNRALARQRLVDGNAGTPWQQMLVNAFIAAVQGGVIVDPDNDDDRGDGGGVAHEGSHGSDATTPGSSTADSGEATLRGIEQRVPSITVLVGLQVLLSGLVDTSVCETEDGIALPVSTVRRLCCDAEIIPAVLGTKGEILDVGRSARTVNRAQRRALRAMHRTCGHPGCTVAFSACNIHHVRWWQRDRGPTDIDNLLPLCERHHHIVHEGRWTLTMTPDRVATWTRPDGEVHHVGSTIDRRPASTPPPRAAFTGVAGVAGVSGVAGDNRPADVPMTT